MPRFHRKSQHRKQARPDARWLVLGLTGAEAVLYHGRRVHLTPKRPKDHPARYAEGRTLQIKAYVGGPTVCRVVTTQAHRMRLGDVDDRLARELGYASADELIADHDVPADREAWVIRFRLDTEAAPRLLALRSEEGYTATPARALPGEAEALTEDEHRRHVQGGATARERERRDEQQAARERMSLERRAEHARAQARLKAYKMRDEFRRLDRLIERGRTEEAVRQIELIEARVFPRAA